MEQLARNSNISMQIQQTLSKDD